MKKYLFLFVSLLLIGVISSSVQASTYNDVMRNYLESNLEEATSPDAKYCLYYYRDNGHMDVFYQGLISDEEVCNVALQEGRLSNDWVQHDGFLPKSLNANIGDVFNPIPQNYGSRRDSIDSNIMNNDDVARVYSAPECTFDVGSLKDMASFCNCNGNLIDTNSGRFCSTGSNSLSVCDVNQLASCGIQENIIRYVQNPTSSATPTVVSEYSLDVGSSSFIVKESDIHYGEYVMSFWAYIDEPLDSFSLSSNVPHEYNSIVFSHGFVNTSGSVWYHEESDRSVFNGEQTRSIEGFDERGWYLVQVELIRYGISGGAQTFELGLDEGVISDYFDIVNSNGPVLFDLEDLDPTQDEDAKWICENNPYMQGDYFEGGFPDAEGENNEFEMRCCGWSPDDYGQSFEGLGMCTPQGWGSQDSVCLAPDGTSVEGTHFSQGAAACCGFEAGTVEESFCGLNSSAVSDRCTDIDDYDGCLADTLCKINNEDLLEEETLTISTSTRCSDRQGVSCPEGWLEVPGSKVMGSCSHGNPGSLGPQTNTYVGGITCRNKDLSASEDASCVVDFGGLEDANAEICEGRSDDSCVDDTLCTWYEAGSTLDTTNLGSIETAANNNYLCTVTRDASSGGDPNSFFSTGILAPSPDNFFVWREANTDPFKIIDAGDGEGLVRHAVSNIDEWFVCDATNSYSQGGNALEDLEFLPAGESLNFSMCYNLIGAVSDFNLNILDCDEDTNVCKENVTSSEGLYDGYCRNNAAVDDSFDNKYQLCFNDCELYEDEDWVPVTQEQLISGGLDGGSSGGPVQVPSFCWDPRYDDHPDCVGNGESSGAEDAPLIEDTCEDAGMLLIDENQALQCTGALFRDSESDLCCDGSLLDRNEIALEMGDEFICHQRAGNDLIRQCGVSMTAWNFDENQKLNDVESLYPMGVVASAGEPLQSLYVSRGDDISRSVAERRTLEGDSRTNYINLELSNFGGAEELVFFYRQLDEGDVELVLDNGEVFNLSNGSNFEGFKGVGFTNKVVINISELASSFDRLYFNNPGSQEVVFLFNNVYLRGGTDLSDNAFCSSPWSDWHVNLDGPDRDDNSGYFGIEAGERDETELGSKEFACNSIPGYGWTGSACCGDDSQGLGSDEYYGEFFVDEQGACIGSGFVPDGRTVASSTGNLMNNLFGNVPGHDNSSAEKFLQFEGRLHACNLDTADTILHNRDFRFDGTDEDYNSDYKFEDFIKDNYTSFDIVGRHICLSGGWKNVDDMDRVQLMATTLLETAKGDFSLYCGDTREVSNFIPEGFNLASTESVCILKNSEMLVDDTSSAVSVIAEISDDVEDRLVSTYLSEHIAGSFLPFNDSNSFENLGCEGESFFNQCDREFLDAFDFDVYTNDLFGLVAFTSDSEFSNTFSQADPQGIFSALSDWWDTLASWFRAILVGSSNEGVLQGNFIFEQDSFDGFYHSRLGLVSVTGYLQEVNGEFNIRVDYTNLTQSISDLRDLNPEKENIFVAQNGNVQTLMSENLSSFEPWARVTGGLRLSAESQDPTNFDLSCEAPLVNISSECGFAECYVDSECENQLVSETLVCNESSKNLDSVSNFSVARCLNYQCIAGLGQYEETTFNHTICEYGCQQNENEEDICVQSTDALCGFGNGIIDADYVDPDEGLDDGITDSLCASGSLNDSSIVPSLNSAVVGEELSWVCEGLAGGANRDCSATVFGYDTGQVEGFDVQVNGDIRIGPDHEGGYNAGNTPACSEFAEPLSLEFSWGSYETSESEVEVDYYVVQHDLYGYDLSIEVNADSNSLQLDESNLDMAVIMDIPWKFNIRAVTNYGGAGPWSEEVQVVADVALCLVAESGDESGDNEGGGNPGGGDGSHEDEQEGQDSPGSGGGADQFQ